MEEQKRCIADGENDGRQQMEDQRRCVSDGKRKVDEEDGNYKIKSDV